MFNNQPSLYPEIVIARFWDKVSVGGAEECWTWTAGRTSTGYGGFNIPGHPPRAVKAHRISFELANGSFPNNLHVLHRCDNPLCVNPRHLFLGTQADNMADKVSKGRQASGAKLPWTKLSEDAVYKIRMATGSQKEIAKRFGICQPHVSDIRTGKKRAERRSLCQS